VRYHLFRSETVERSYQCPRCETRATTFVRGHGASSFSPGLFSDDAEMAARENAAMSMQHDATRVLGLIQCPSCKLRAPGAVGWSIARLVTTTVFLTALLVGSGLALGYAGGWPMWLVPLLGAFGLIAGVWTEIGRWREAGRATLRLTGVKAGAMPLPKAVALRRLPAAPPAPAPIVPIASVAPPKDPEPPAPGEGPRFLRKD
jgi:hypothetical protein